MKTVCLIFSMVIAVAEATAQISLPQFDVELKGGYAKMDAGWTEIAQDVYYTPLTGGLHVQISQRIAVGGFYSRGSGEIIYQGEPAPKFDLSVLMYGIDLRFSGGRGAKWRPFIGLVYGKAEFVQKTSSVNLSSKSTVLGADVGVMMQLGRNLYWKVIEVSPRYLPTEVFYTNSNFCAEAKMGLLYNIRLKSK